MSLNLSLNRILSLFMFAGLVSAFGGVVYAQDNAAAAQRSIELEIEPIEGAVSYEIELISVANKKVLNFKMKTPLWKAKVKPGLYEMRLRSFDSRGVPGDWSPGDKFAVNFAAPTMLSPLSGAQIKSGEDDTYSPEFKWTSVPGAKKYRVTVLNKLVPDKSYIETTDETSIKISLPVAQQYDWTVVALMMNDQEGDKPEASVAFDILAKPLELPQIERPFDKYVQKITWEKPDSAETFDYSVQRKDGKAWKTVEKKMGTTVNEIVFSNEWSGGDYRLNVRAQGRLRESSKFSSVEFPVHNGDRSPAAVEVARLQESMQKPTNWYAVASYLLTDIQYSAVDAEQGKTVKYGAIGGTGRLGLGYFTKDKTKGFVGILDMSGMNVSGKNVTYTALDLNYVRSYYWNSNQIQVSGGLFYKELPFSRETSTHIYTHDKIGFAGPHIGGVLWHPFNPKYGVQVNARAYMSALSLKTPNGNDVENSLSMQVGAMGSMRLTPRLMGFAGWAYRDDKVAYKRGTVTTAAKTGPNQEVSLKGHYVNMLLEYGF